MSNCAVRFMDNNLALPATARITYSSSKSGFPGTNAYDQRRSRLWITGGNFTITASNNKLYINDGTNKTVTLDSGNYTYAALATHIQTKLNASSTNWTCTYSTTTRKFTITRTSGTAVLRTSQLIAPVFNSIGFATGPDDPSKPFVSDFPVNHTDEWYKADFVQPVPIQAFMACWKNGVSKAFSGDADIRVQFNNVDDWASPALEFSLTAFDRGIFQFFDDDDTSYRYCRFWFSNPRASCGPEGFMFGNIYMGSYRTVTVSNVAPEIGAKLEDLSKIQVAASGAEYANVKGKRRKWSSMEMQLLEASERRALQQTISRLGNTEHFYFCLDPTSAVTQDLDEATFYAKFDSEPDLKHVIRDYWTLSFDLKEAI